MLESPSIVVIGSLNMDLVLRVARAPEPGETLCGQALKLVPGGKGANQAVACARLGGRVAMVGRVGGDQLGTQLRHALSKDGVVIESVTTDNDASTGVALIMVDDAAQNRIVIVPGSNATLSSAHVDEADELIQRSELVLLQLETPLPTVQYAIQRAVALGKRVLLNPAPAQPLPPALIAQLDYLVPNETEASILTGIDVRDTTSAARAARELMHRGAQRVLITLGAQGVLIADAEGVRDYAPPPVQAVDTTAAGDTFIGALAVGLVERMTLDAAAQFALRAAALSVTRMGAQTSIPYRSELSV